MPKRSTKSKSKRVSLKQKYKVIKKVREHHRKKRREERKAGKKAPKVKDPGIPSQWPFKEELIKEFAWKRQQILMQEKEKREARKRAREERAAMEEDPGAAAEMEELQAGAAAKQRDFEDRKRARLAAAGVGNGAGDQDGSRRAFYKEFRRVVEASDVVIQVLDARDPEGCRCPDVERYVRSLDPGKRIILLLNKMDLVPREIGEQWLKYYRQELPTVAFKASTQQQGSGLSAAGKQSGKPPGKRAASAAADVGSGCLGADTLLQLLKNYARNRGMKTAITVGVVGLPNVGKSSLINSLKRSRVAQVGNTPGVTRGVQEVVLDKSIRLLDSPGIIFSADDDAAAALRNAVKVERLADPLAPVAVILDRVPKKQLMAVYKIPAFADVDEFLRHIAAARGKLKRGGVPDLPAAARIVLQDWNGGAIPFYTLPPSRGNEEFESAAVVGNWAAEFDADKVFADEEKAVIAHLPASDAAGAFFEAASAGRARVDLAAAMEDDDTAPAARRCGGGAAAAAANGAAGGSGSGEEGPEEMEDEDDYGAKRKKAAAAAAGGAQLYAEAGQFNPHRARADKKARKKARALSEAAAAGGDDSDFDFDEANENEGAAGGSGSGSGSDGDDYGRGGGGSKDADAAYADDMEGSDLE